MKICIACAFVIVILVICPVAFGEIIPDWGEEGSGGPFGTSLSVGANGSIPDDSNWGGGFFSQTTDEAGDFDWFLEAHAYSYAEGTLLGGSLQAWASASASASSPYGSGYRSASSYVSGSYDDEDEPSTYYDAGTDDHFDAWSGVSAANFAMAEAHVTAQSSSFAGAEATATATCSMY